ncbi:MAG: nucleoside 2-deoxyribosyltransferase [Salinivirgaceae bacterium]
MYPKNINIYFAASIRGGRDYASEYQKMITELHNYGNVLTEHIADNALLAQEAHLSDEQIHDRDVEWLRQSDVVVAEVTQTSMGVGYELATALFLNKPVLCLFNNSHGRQLSAMIKGQTRFTLKNYVSLHEAFAAIEQFFAAYFLKQSQNNIVNNTNN